MRSCSLGSKSASDVRNLAELIEGTCSARLALPILVVGENGLRDGIP
jgi:hypothetical protein